MTALTRRDVIHRLAGAGAGLALSDVIVRGQSVPIGVAGKPVEIVVSSISDSTVRITALPVEAGVMPADDSLVAAASGRILARRRAPTTQAVRAGHLAITITSSPPSIHISTLAGAAVQRLTLCRRAGRQ